MKQPHRPNTHLSKEKTFTSSSPVIRGKFIITETLRGTSLVNSYGTLVSSCVSHSDRHPSYRTHCICTMDKRKQIKIHYTPYYTLLIHASFFKYKLVI